MARFTVPLCRQCGADLPKRRPGQPGPSRLYCTARCRKRAERQRCRLAFAGPLDELRDLELPPLPALGTADEQLAAVLRELKGNAGALARMGAALARPEFAWRCEELAAKIRASLAENFPGL